jgi:hypothetical protein
MQFKPVRTTSDLDILLLLFTALQQRLLGCFALGIASPEKELQNLERES